jgi:GntR family transcriptional regulator
MPVITRNGLEVAVVDRLNRKSKMPLYHQLYEILRNKIVGREWQPGAMIPPESELIAQYQVSRITVRQVLDLLVKERLIYRQRGRGTFVAHPAIEQTLVRIVSFTDDMRQRGFAPNTVVLASALIPAPQEIAAHLEIEPGEELAYLKRLRLADGEPMSIEESHLVHRFCLGVLQGDYASTPLREALERDYGIRWSRATQVIRAAQASREMAQTLAVPLKSALLHIERVSYSQQNIPVEFLRVYYRGDQYALHNELIG